MLNFYSSGMVAHRHFSMQSMLLDQSIEKLSTGLRINRAGDDPAGLAISEKMRAQIRGLDQASRNAQDGISMIQTAEGGLNETHAIIQRMRELAVQASNDTYIVSDREAMQSEMYQLAAEIDRIGNSTEFNTKKLLNGSSTSVSLQIGANQGQQMNISFQDMRTNALGVDAIDLTSHDNATDAINQLDQALSKVSSERSRMGSYQNRLGHTISNLTNSSLNLTSAESRIRDVDMAKEMMEMTKRSLLSQVALAMIAQANQQSQFVLRLLQP
ncbi:flagellin [Jeotgalibacillus salarius]|uniref:Flagellin n=2 Tax=Jeotgalibacillus salarius TaxID=546023 RepID=A0A4Y8LMF6_9BACL|nr:flagellin [Jeotgalibacillus salarius]